MAHLRQNDTPGIGAIRPWIFLLLSFVLCFAGCDDAEPLPPSDLHQRAYHSTNQVDETLRNLPWGNVAHDAPPTMKWGETTQIELLLSPSESVAELQAKLNATQAEEVAGETIQISNRMEAELTGRGFEIEPLTPDIQAVSGEKITRWEWDVTPTDHGIKRLHLTLAAHIDVSGHDTPLILRTYDRDIVVEITFGQRVSHFVENNWQWLWAAILVPLVGLLWRLLRRPKNTTEKGAP